MLHKGKRLKLLIFLSLMEKVHRDLLRTGTALCSKPKKLLRCGLAIDQR
jgi:hypothetical protein